MIMCEEPDKYTAGEGAVSFTDESCAKRGRFPNSHDAHWTIKIADWQSGVPSLQLQTTVLRNFGMIIVRARGSARDTAAGDRYAASKYPTQSVH
jgi:hypothetical protein